MKISIINKIKDTKEIKNYIYLSIILSFFSLPNLSYSSQIKIIKYLINFSTPLYEINGTPSKDITIYKNSSFLKIETHESTYRTKKMYILYNITNKNDIYGKIYEWEISGLFKNYVNKSGIYGDRIQGEIVITETYPKFPDDYISKPSDGNIYEYYYNYTKNLPYIRISFRDEFGIERSTFSIVTKYNSCHKVITDNSTFNVVDDSYHRFKIFYKKENSTHSFAHIEIDNITTIRCVSNNSIEPLYLLLSGWGWDYKENDIYEFKDFNLLIKHKTENNLSVPKNYSIFSNSVKNHNFFISTKNPFIITTNCNKRLLKNLEKYISNETTGINTCFETNYNFDSYEDFLDYLNISKSIAVFSNDKETLLYSYLLATKLNLPLIQNPDSWQTSKFKQVYNITSKDQAINFYLKEIKRKNQDIDGLVLANINSENAFLASRIAALYNLFPIFVNITHINYSENVSDANDKNKVFDIRNKIIDTIDYLSKQGFFYRSKNFMLKNKDPYVIIVGEDVPYFEINDPIPKLSVTCITGFCDKFILTDSPYCNFNKTLNSLSNEILLQHGICSRIIGSPEEISYQIEVLRKHNPETNNILIINDYSDLPALSWLSFSNMVEGYNTYSELIAQNMNVTRMVERRSPYDEINAFVIKDIIKNILDTVKDVDDADQFSKILTTLNFLKTIFTQLTYMYEYDWHEGINRFKKSGYKDFSIKPFPQINETKINNYRTIIYLANYSNSGLWFMTNKTFNFTELSDRIHYIFNLHSNSANTTTKNIIKIGSLPITTLSSKIVPGYNALAAKYIFRNVSYPIGYAIKNSKNYMLGIAYFIQQQGRTFEIPPMNPYYKLSASLELNSLPVFSLVNKTTIPSNKPLKVEYSSPLLIINKSIEPKCKFFEYNNKTLILCSEDYITIKGMPKIPIFHKKLELPRNSKVIEVKFIPKYSHIENVFIPIVGNESNFTKFPNDFIFSSIRKSFGNKSIVDIFYTPVIYYNNGSADVLEEVQYKIEFDTPFEILSFKILRNENTTGLVKIYSNKDQQAILETILLTKGKKLNLSYKIKLSKGINYNKISLGKLKSGKYNITIILYNNNSVITFTKEFYVKNHKKKTIPIISYFIQTFFGNQKYYKDFSKTTFIKSENNSTYIKIKSWNYTLEIYEKPNSKTIILTTPEAKYTRINNINKSVEIVESPYGSLKNSIENGSLKQTYYGKLSYLEKMMNKFRDYTMELMIINDM